MSVNDVLVIAKRSVQVWPRLGNPDWRIAVLAASAAAVIATAALAGWVFEAWRLPVFGPGEIPLKPATALGLLTCAAALLLAALAPRADRTRIALGAAASSFGLAALFEHAGATGLGVDNPSALDASLFLPESIVSAAAFVALGAALMLSKTGSGRLQGLRAALAGAVIVAALTGIFGHFISPIDPSMHGSLLSFGLPTAIAFLALGVGVLALDRTDNAVSDSVGVVAPIIGLAAMAGLVAVTFVAVDRQHHIREDGRMARTAADSLGRLLDWLRDAEIGQRGYLLTGAESDLQRYSSATPRIGAEIAAMRPLFAASPETRQALEHIDKLTEAELDELGRTIALRRGGDMAGAVAIVDRGDGRRIMGQLRRDIAQTQDAWLRHADGLRDAADRTLTWLQYGTLIAVSVVLTLSAFPLLDARRRFALMRQAQTRLADANQELDQKVAQRTQVLVAALDATRAALRSREEAEAALRRSDRRLGLLLETSATMVFSVSPDGRRMRRLTGADASAVVETVHEDWLESLVPTEDRARVIDAIELARRAKGPFELEHRIRKPDGSLGWVASRAIPVLDDEGEIVEWFGAATDITARKSAELALQASEERLRFSLASARAGAWRWTIASDDLSWSPEMFELHGIAPDEAGSSYGGWLASIHPDDRIEAEKTVQLALANRDREYRVEYRVRAPAFGARWLLGVGRIEYAFDGTALGMSGISLDITRQKRAEIAARASEAALGRSELRLRNAADAARLTYAEIDLLAGGLTVAENFAAVMGYAPRAVVGPRAVGEIIEDLVRTEDPAARAASLEAIQALLAGAPQAKLELEVRRPDGTSRRIESVWTVETGGDGSPARLFLTNLDVTSLVEAKSEAERANLAKSKFLAAASHDLRQPVQSLVLLLGLVEKQVRDNPKARLTVEKMSGALAGLNGMLTGILDLSRLDAGAIEPETEIVGVGPLLDRLAVEYGPKASARGLRLRVRTADLWVSTDPALFERALRNLIENALRYTPRGGVLIAARRRGGCARIDVIDTGIGVPAEKQAEIFEEFHQLHNPGRDLGQGLGLGLAIVARLAALLGARVEVSSRPGRGSRFSLLHPLAPDARAEEAVAQGEPNEVRGSVLIIEDNDILRLSLEAMVADWGYAATVAASGEEALTLCSRGARFDAIVTDYRLGDRLSGVEAALEIERELGRVLPKLVLTGDTAKESLAEIHASGFRYLHKPVSVDVLRRKLAELLSAS